MFRLRHLPLLAVLTVTGCEGHYGYTPEQEKLLKRLDATIGEIEVYRNAKVMRINEIKSRADSAMSEEETYSLYDRLYLEYYQYDIDSTISYARKKLAVARHIADRDAGERRDSLLYDAEFDLADRYVLSGMYAEVLDIVNPMDMESLPRYLRPRYYHILNTLYTGMAEASDDPVLKTAYLKKKNFYRREMYNLLGDDDIAKIYIWSDIELDRGNAPMIVDSLLSLRSSVRLDVHEFAVISYIAAEACRQCGRDDESIALFAESAIHDIVTPVMEYRSLYRLAALLYQKRDFTRAYRYINLSISDAVAANARLNVSAINCMLPLITQSYDNLMQRRQAQLYAILTLLSLVTVLLIAEVRKSIRSRRELALANSNLKEYVGLLQEANNIKESYLGRYMDMCSDYIEGLERYRSSLKKAVKGGLPEVIQALKSTEFTDRELDEFYARFDASFLDLFPDFIEEVNALLCDGRKLEVKGREGILSTELRVAALIRLGITDSVQIAHFLRRSTSTIYNYRVKMRNAAKSSREDIEKQIMHIGRLS